MRSILRLLIRDRVLESIFPSLRVTIIVETVSIMPRSPCDRSIKLFASEIALSPSNVVNTIKPKPVGNSVASPNSSKYTRIIRPLANRSRTTHNSNVYGTSFSTIRYISIESNSITPYRKFCRVGSAHEPNLDRAITSVRLDPIAIDDQFGMIRFDRRSRSVCLSRRRRASFGCKIRSLGNFNIRPFVMRFDRWKAKPRRNSRFRPFRFDYDL
jgi:hypothetical protein